MKKSITVSFICMVIFAVITLSSGCGTNSMNIPKSKNIKQSVPETVAGYQISNKDLIEPSTLYSITELRSLVSGRTAMDDPTSSPISLSEIKTAFPTPYFRYIEDDHYRECYLAYPVREGGVYIVDFLLPGYPDSDLSLIDPSQCLAFGDFWVHGLLSTGEFGELFRGQYTLKDIRAFQVPEMRSLIEPNQAPYTAYYLLSEQMCAKVTLESNRMDSAIRSIEYIARDDSPFYIFLSKDLEDTEWTYKAD